MIVKILGTGCPKCKLLEENVRKAVKELNKDISIEKIEDLDTIIKYGIMTTPALIIDEKVIFAGKVLSVEKLKKYFE
jgi:small redox-active disulfide protein 2